MVGVPGKYKGCETCRRRRVKCTNERPHCQKCVASGRPCEGYERERIFITGTPETKGRVASHPKKGTPPKKQKTPAEFDSKADLIPMQPLTSAWDDFISLSSHGIEYSLLTTALQTKLGYISREEPIDDDAAGFAISLPPYVPLELQPSMVDVDFEARAQCIAQLAPNDDGEDSTESYCIYLFEQNFAATPNMEAWRLTADQMSLVRRLGPSNFSAFPNHHFFVRVYRPMAVSLALLSRRDTYLANPEWTTIPWEQHPKCLLDQLFDIVLFLPSIFARVDRLVPMQATLERRHRAQELLHNCLALEAQFRQWLQQASMGNETHHLPYWAEELVSPGTEIPFANAYTFRDGLTGLQFLYYWMSQILFHRSIDTLYRTIFQPVLDSYPNMWPDLPSDLHIDQSQYQDSRELAANICRGLDSTLNNTVQPDMLLAPMTVALDVYREINATSHDGVLEIIWLEAFKGRLMEKGQHVANVVQSQRWMEVANF